MLTYHFFKKITVSKIQHSKKAKALLTTFCERKSIQGFKNLSTLSLSDIFSSNIKKFQTQYIFFYYLDFRLKYLTKIIKCTCLTCDLCFKNVRKIAKKKIFDSKFLKYLCRRYRANSLFLKNMYDSFIFYSAFVV